MEYREFCELTRQTLQQLLPRIPERLLRVFELMQIGGEYGMLVKELVHTVVKEQVAVSPAELEVLRVLARDLNEGTDLVAMLEQVQPQAEN